MLTQPSLTLARRLKASPAQVFAAWTKPEKIVQWFGPAETTPDSVKVYDLDVRVGGAFRISFVGNDGEYHEVGGKYLEVVPNERLVFSWAWHSTPERESSRPSPLDSPKTVGEPGPFVLRSVMPSW